MKTLFPFLKPYRKECVLAPLFKLLEALLELFVPLLMAAIIDKGIMASDSGYVLRTGLILVGLGLLGFGASATAQYFSARAATGFSADIKSSLFAHIQRFSYADLDRLGSSTLINRMTTDVNQMQTGVNMVLRLLLRSPFVVFGATIMAFTVNARAALIFLALLPLLTLTVVGITKLTLPRYQRVQGQLDKVLLHTRENVAGVRVLRAFRMQQAETAAYKSDNDELTRMQLRVGRLSVLMNPLTFILVNAALIVLLKSGAVQVNNGALQTGEMVALVNYLNQILVELVKLANLIITMTKSMASAARVENVLKLEPSMKDPASPVTPASDCRESVGFDHVSTRYPEAGADSLTDVTFKALKGQTIGVIGGIRFRQEYTDSTDSPLLRRFLRQRPGGRRGCASAEHDGPAAADRRGAAKSRPVPRHHPGEPSLGRPRALRMKSSGRRWKPRRPPKSCAENPLDWTKCWNRTAATFPAARSSG